MEYLLNHIFDILTFLVALSGVVIALREYIRANSFQKSKAISDLFSEIKKDEGMFQMFYEIEYGTFIYDDSFHHDKKEKDLDNLLLLLNHVCYLYERKIISSSELNQLKYIINRTVSDFGVQNYLYNIYYFSKYYFKKQGIDGSCPFYTLIEYGLKNGLIEKDSFNTPPPPQDNKTKFTYILGE